MSSTNNSRLAARKSSTDKPSARPGPGCTRTLDATVAHTASGSVTGANSHNHAPSGNSPMTSSAAWSARRVLPTPPSPVKVTSDDRHTSSATDAISVSRPTNVVI